MSNGDRPSGSNQESGTLAERLADQLAGKTVEKPAVKAAHKAPPAEPPPHMAPPPPPPPSRGGERRSAKRRGPVRRFFGRMVSNILFAAIAVAVVFGYLNREELLTRSGNFVCGDKMLGPWAPKKDGASGAATQTPIKPLPPEEVKKAPVPAEPVEQKATPAAPAEPVEQTAAPAAPAQPAPDKKEDVTAATGEDSLTKALASARQAYQAGDSKAIAAYEELIRKYPDNPDLPGELGNIYYSEGKLKEAGEKYFDTARLLLNSSSPDKAACLLPVLKRIAPARAEELGKLVTGTCPN